MEALASGLPVLCSHNGGTKELVKDSGVIIELEDDYEIGTELDLYDPPKVDVETIADGVLSLIEMPKIQQRNDLNISNICKQYIKAFENEDIN